MTMIDFEHAVHFGGSISTLCSRLARQGTGLPPFAVPVRAARGAAPRGVAVRGDHDRAVRDERGAAELGRAIEREPAAEPGRTALARAVVDAVRGRPRAAEDHERAARVPRCTSDRPGACAGGVGWSRGRAPAAARRTGGACRRGCCPSRFASDRWNSDNASTRGACCAVHLYHGISERSHFDVVHLLTTRVLGHAL